MCQSKLQTHNTLPWIRLNTNTEHGKISDKHTHTFIHARTEMKQAHSYNKHTHAFTNTHTQNTHPPTHTHRHTIFTLFRKCVFSSVPTSLYRLFTLTLLIGRKTTYVHTITLSLSLPLFLPPSLSLFLSYSLTLSLFFFLSLSLSFLSFLSLSLSHRIVSAQVKGNSCNTPTRNSFFCLFVFFLSVSSLVLLLLL